MIKNQIIHLKGNLALPIFKYYNNNLNKLLILQ